MNVVVAPDKFKGSLSADEAARAIAAGLRSVWPEAKVLCLPVADGGEGTAEVLHQACGGEWCEAQARDPLGRGIRARFSWIENAPDGPLAVIEMSEASGLRRLQPDERTPLDASTAGTGDLLNAAIQKGARRIVIGLGGSATNDGGIGLAGAMGFRFVDNTGQELPPTPRSLPKIARIEPTLNGALPEITAAVDVRNPLLGPRGATRTFGPQKGADAEALECLEAGLRNLAEVAARDLKLSVHETPGAGAAGGLGFGLLAFCKAAIRSGFEIVAEAINLDRAIAGSDIVFTAEGSMDAQTLEGKAPAGVAAIARKHGKRVIGFAGRVQDEAQLRDWFDAVVPIPNRPLSIAESCQEARALLESAAARTARLLT